ncbi:hypothetical protein [Thermomonas sp.]|uniref:hypothetical protein n=1 Tax=Thermomonas sp. TaxID=1971895 RepID=UPI002488AFC6|nr:hypothetical protein [Thermomonas sp.]MDI1252715.1 hypothetical protein [Thermomonas sp.]
MPTRFYISLPDPSRVRGADVTLAFQSQGADGLAAELQDALRSDGLFERWRAQQEDPDEVDPALGATDANATVLGEQHDLHIDLIVITSLPSAVMRQRLGLLAGNGWQLRDVSAA